MSALPYKTQVTKNPVGIGARLKSFCDGESDILPKLDYMEDQEAQGTKKFFSDYSLSIALIVKHYFGTGINLPADSAFGTVAAAEVLRSRGVYLMRCM